MKHTKRSGDLGSRFGRRRLAAVAAVAALALLGAACGDDDGTGTGTGTGADTSADAELLGPRQPASGEPVKVGVISDGRTPAFDNSIQFDAAEAVATFINEHRGGIGGRPIELVTCETAADPAKATDCANQFVQADVQIVAIGEITGMAQVWGPLHDAGIPIIVYGTTEASALLDQDSTFVLASQITALADFPIAVAKEHGLKKVTVVVIDVPVATGFYDTVGTDFYKEAGIELEVIAVPPGTADMTTQMSRVSSGETAVHVIGNDSFCIAAFNGLRAMNFTGPVSVLNQCITDSSRSAVGDYLEGMYMASPSALGDRENRDLLQWEAIARTYGEDIDLSNAMGPAMYMTMMAMREALDGISGEITSASMIETIKSMPKKPLPLGSGLDFQCNGQAYPLTPAVCVDSVLVTTLDKDGQPVPPYRPVSELGAG